MPLVEQAPTVAFLMAVGIQVEVVNPPSVAVVMAALAFTVKGIQASVGKLDQAFVTVGIPDLALELVVDSAPMELADLADPTELKKVQMQYCQLMQLVAIPKGLLMAFSLARFDYHTYPFDVY